MNSKDDTLVTVKDVEKLYPIRSTFAESLRSEGQKHVRAVSGVSLQIRRGEILGLAGQSGCGKTTLGLLLTLLERPTKGSIVFEGVDVSGLRGKALKAFRRKVQIVFQDPYESLNPRYRVEETVMEPLLIHKVGESRAVRQDMVKTTLERAELRPADKFLRNYPHELSGGERQRVAIARAIVLDPLFLVADEPVSMLDVSVRAGLLNLMLRLKEELSMTYLFITHDLSVARYMSDRLAIMYFGKIVELGSTEAVLRNGVHPYTQLLIASVPIPDPTIERDSPVADRAVSGSVTVPVGCYFSVACPSCMETCHSVEPELVEVESGHFVACHRAL